MTRNGVVVKHLLYPLWNGRPHQVFRFSSSFASSVSSHTFKARSTTWMLRSKSPVRRHQLCFDFELDMCVDFLKPSDWKACKIILSRFIRQGWLATEKVRHHQTQVCAFFSYLSQFSLPIPSLNLEGEKLCECAWLIAAMTQWRQVLSLKREKDELLQQIQEAR